MTVVSAAAGGGRTVLLRSWIGQAGLTGSAAWVPAGRDQRDPQQFWLCSLAVGRPRHVRGGGVTQPDVLLSGNAAGRMACRL